MQAQEALGLLNGALNIPLPTYFGLGNHSLPACVAEKLEASGEVCPNLFCLGRKGSLKTSEGVRIAMLGGRLAESDGSQPGALGNYLPDDVEPPSDAQCISDLCSALKPRHHFTPSQAYYSREPFFYPRSEDEHEVIRLTWFEVLVPFNNKKKEKWFYIFRFDLSALSLIMVSADATPTLFTIIKKRALPDHKETYSRYSNGNTWRLPKKRRQSNYTKLENCFFCISSPTLQIHLITSMADESYLTIPRGPLPPRTLLLPSRSAASPATPSSFPTPTSATKPPQTNAPTSPLTNTPSCNATATPSAVWSKHARMANSAPSAGRYHEPISVTYTGSSYRCRQSSSARGLWRRDSKSLLRMRNSHRSRSTTRVRWWKRRATTFVCGYGRPLEPLECRVSNQKETRTVKITTKMKMRKEQRRQ